MLTALGALFLLAAATVFSVFVGFIILRRIGFATDDRLAELIFAGVAGLGAMSLILFLLGLVGGLRPFTLVPVIYAAAVLLNLRYADEWRRRVGDFWSRAASSRRWRPGALTVLVTLAILTMAALSFTGVLAPPTTNEWDAIAYHLALPKLWLQSHRIHPVPYDSHSDFPMLMEMLFSIGLDFGSVAAAKSFHWLFGMWAALACYWAGRRWVSPKAGLLAAALFLAAPIVGWEMTIAYVDLAAACYVALSVFAFLVWLEGRDAPEAGNGWLILAGIMAGFACGVKYTMIATTGLLVLWAVGLAIAKRQGVTWKHAGILAGVAALVACPWYIRTWIWTGNPVYPFFYSVFGGRWWSASAAVDYVREQSRFGIGKTLYGFWVSPWSTAFFAQYYANPPAKFTGALAPSPPVNTFAAIFGSLGIGVIGLLPLWLLKPGVERGDGGRGGNGALAAMVWYSAAFLVVWFALTHQTRYLMVLLPLLLVPAVAGARTFWHLGRGWRAGVGAFCAVALLWGIIPLYALVQPAFAVAWGAESPDTYLTAREPMYRVSKRINETLPPDAKLLLLQETRGYYIDRPYQWGNPSQNALIPWDSFKRPEQMDATLRADGFTHVLVNWAATPPEISREHWPQLAHAAIESGQWTTVFTMDGWGVYRISGG